MQQDLSPIPANEAPAPTADVLLVDDHPAHLPALEAILAAPGRRLVHVPSGEEALRLLLERDFAVVLMAVRLRGLDGIETARRIRGREPSRRTPIIFVAESDDGRLPVEEAYALGAVDFLVKPLAPVVLRAKVAGFIDLFQKTEQVKRQADQLREMERREFERKLAEENARFRALTEHSSDAVTLIGPDGTVRYTTPSVRRVLGYEPGEFLGRSGFEIVHPDDRESIMSRLVELAGQPGTPVTVEMRVRHKDGSWRWVECVGTNLLDEPAVGAVVVNFRDVSARRLATDALRQSEDRFARFMQHLPGLAWIKDVQGRYVYANDAAMQAFGAPRTDLYGKTDDEVFPADTAAQFKMNDRLALDRGIGVQVIETLEHPDGVLHYSLVSKFPISGPDGKAAMVGGMAIDVTEQKRTQAVLEESEHRFRQLAENVNAVFWMSDPQKGRILYISPAYEAVWGRSCQSLYDQPRSFLDSVHPEDRERVVALSLERQERGETADVEYRVVRPDGSIRWVRDRGFPIKDPSGRLYRVAGIAEDVTERRQAEEEARRFQFISDHSNDAHFLIDREARFLYVNRRTVELLGSPEAELLRMAVHDVDPSFPLERHRDLFDRLHRGERVAPFETSVIRIDRTVVPVEISVTGVAFEGRPFLFAVARDITERKRIENALRESEGRLRTLSNNLPNGAIYQGATDAEGRGRFTYISAGVERLFGVTPDEVTGDPRTLYGLIHEEDLPRMMAEEAAALRDLTPFDCEFRSRTRGGGVVWIHCRSAPRRLPEGGAVWDGVILDVTERRRAVEALRRSEERFRRLIEADIVGVGVSDGNGAWLEANDELLRIIGFSREEVEGGRVRWMDGTPEQYLALDEERVAEAHRRGACTPYEKEYIRKDGSLVPVLLGYAALGESGNRFICVVLDLTAQKRVEAALKEADRRKDEFLAMLAHELRNPLAPVRDAVHMMKLLGPVDPKVQRARDTIERQVEHLARLVDDLLDVSRITRGKIALQKATVDLSGVVARAVETSRPLIDARRHDLTVTLPPGQVRLDGDATRLAQVVSNLLNNAAKYTEEGGRIWLTVELGQGEVAVRVKDSGLGIPADLLPQVFNLFTQGDRSPARSEGGLGVGLTLVKSLVEMHGGRVEAHSDGPGKGSEFIVRLPTLPPGSPLPEDVGGTKPAGLGSAPSRRILVVDDNVDVAEMLALVLREEGHEVRTAHDGPAALQLAESFNPHVVLLDIGLPRMDGYEVARRLREQPGLKKVLLVALTGYGQEEDRRRAEKAGFDVHLVKPADPAALQSLLAGHAAADG